MARKNIQNGTEKDSQEGLKMESSRQKEKGKAKNDAEKNLWKDLEKMLLIWGTAEIEVHGEKGVPALSSIDRGKQRRIHYYGSWC